MQVRFVVCCSCLSTGNESFVLYFYYSLSVGICSAAVALSIFV
jgi:hypothetical protein